MINTKSYRKQGFDLYGVDSIEYCFADSDPNIIVVENRGETHLYLWIGGIKDYTRGSTTVYGLTPDLIIPPHMKKVYSSPKKIRVVTFNNGIGVAQKVVHYFIMESMEGEYNPFLQSNDVQKIVPQHDWIPIAPIDDYTKFKVVTDPESPLKVETEPGNPLKVETEPGNPLKVETEPGNPLEVKLNDNKFVSIKVIWDETFAPVEWREYIFDIYGSKDISISILGFHNEHYDLYAMGVPVETSGGMIDYTYSPVSLGSNIHGGKWRTYHLTDLMGYGLPSIRLGIKIQNLSTTNNAYVNAIYLNYIKP